MDETPLKYIQEPEHTLLPQFQAFKPIISPEQPKQRVSRKVIILAACLMFVILFITFHLHISAPASFPEDSIFTVKNGETITNVADRLETTGVIKSSTPFKIFTVIFDGSRGLDAGDYYLEKSQNTVILAWRLSHSRYDLKNIKITIPEGFNSAEIAELFAKEKKFTKFDVTEFKKLAAPYEGYLFPDTYLFLPNITAQGVIDVMIENYKNRIKVLAAEIMVFGRPIEDVINMASIIEEEARTEETRRTIAGILWKRLDEDMPLQVDAAFAFVNGKKESSELTLEDLKIDSPYNTYFHKGLPPTPISNPGLDAIRSTIHPLATKYYFYLSDINGDMHYAITHDGHVANKDRYLR